jgi:beta-phosphoglucomutase-like phosphatase (HAD superfamily)
MTAGAAPGAPAPVQAIIMDLDGLILDTESLCMDVGRLVLARYGKELTPDAQRAALGKRPLCAWRDVAAAVGLEGVPAQQLFDESEPLLEARWVR